MSETSCERCKNNRPLDKANLFCVECHNWLRLDMKQQRDELLAAAKAVARPWDVCNTTTWNEAWDRFEAAVSKAEGE